MSPKQYWQSGYPVHTAMAPAEPPHHAMTASTDQRTSWSWRKIFGKDEKCNNASSSRPTPSSPPPSSQIEDVQTRPGIARRLSRRVVPELPRIGTFKRQQSELRDKLEPAKLHPVERRTVSVDRRRAPSGRNSSTAIVNCPRLSAPEFLDTSTTIEGVLGRSKTVSTEETVPEHVEAEKEPSQAETQSISTAAFDEMILEELEKKWILNLSMHFRDKSKREKFFVTYAETPNRWRRVTISLDYRDAADGCLPNSLEEELLRTRFQRDKSARIYEAIRESLPDIQFYDTVTNLKLQTEKERLHVHVVEDLSEIIQYPSVSAINHLACRRIREQEVIFESHLSGFVYKVRINGEVFIKKEIPGPDTVDEFLYEINALHRLAGSRSVIQFGGVVLDNQGKHVKGLLISFAEQGALIDVIYDGEGRLPWHRRERWARQIVQGLSEIHEAGFVQGDFTLSNIVIDEHDNAKIIDINRRGCPVGWEPPEVAALINSNQRISMYIGVKSDLYQLGMVLYALATQEDEPENHRPLNLSTFPAEIPDYYLDLCSRCLSDDPRRRSQASTLLALFPEIEEVYTSQEMSAPIVVEAFYEDRTPKPTFHQHASYGLHSPQLTDAGRPNVYDYAVTDTSEEGDYFPPRGRSPPRKDRIPDINVVPIDQRADRSNLDLDAWAIPLPSSNNDSESDYMESNQPQTPTADEAPELPSLNGKDEHDTDPQHHHHSRNHTSISPRNTAVAARELAGVGTAFDIPSPVVDMVVDDLTTDTHKDDRLVIEPSVA